MSAAVQLALVVWAEFEDDGFWRLYDDLLGMHSVEHWRTFPEAKTAYASREITWAY